MEMCDETSGRIRKVGGNTTTVTEDRLEKFGQDLTDKLVASLSKLVTKDNFVPRLDRNRDDYNRTRQRVDLSQIECYYCHQFGHYSRKCPKKQNSLNGEQQGSYSQDSNPVNYQGSNLLA